MSRCGGRCRARGGSALGRNDHLHLLELLRRALLLQATEHVLLDLFVRAQALHVVPAYTTQASALQRYGSGVQGSGLGAREWG